MLEIFAGWIIGASMVVLFLHFTGRLTPRQPDTYTRTPDVGFSAIGVSLDGNNGPRLDPYYRRKLEEVLPGSTERLR
jgi:hypothetical protein